MKMDLKTPCSNCPFRNDTDFYLGEERAVDIAYQITSQDLTFSCHKTDRGDDEKDYQHCAGAMIMLENLERPNQWMRICERLGGYDKTKLDMDAPVFKTPVEFILHHETTTPTEIKMDKKKELDAEQLVENALNQIAHEKQFLQSMCKEIRETHKILMGQIAQIEYCFDLDPNDD